MGKRRGEISWAGSGKGGKEESKEAIVAMQQGRN